jgi:nitrogen regulatory protein PII
MKQMKKVEIIIESVYMNRLVDLLKKNDINGYTIIKDIEGCGGHGLKTADDVTDVFSNSYVFTVCEEEKLLSMQDSIKSFIKKYGGKAIISDASLLI